MHVNPFDVIGQDCPLLVQVQRFPFDLQLPHGRPLETSAGGGCPGMGDLGVQLGQAGLQRRFWRRYSPFSKVPSAR